MLVHQSVDSPEDTRCCHHCGRFLRYRHQVKTQIALFLNNVVDCVTFQSVEFFSVYTTQLKADHVPFTGSS